MFVPDHFMDEPEATKEGLRAAYRGLADLDFRHLLLAHGEPFVDSGREALAAFAGAGRGGRARRRPAAVARTARKSSKCVVFASLRIPESFERQLGDRVTKRLKSLASLSGSRSL